ncbi:tRNA lysidine(34) synthetase TilS [Halobacillus yeomjeoni]|uniref:tRNA lysidine(34) synthetase TilS n=1 Tax=Halobacillus yeomjeoni TaxID=311194 RepID=UPI001CD529DF|nr:tRNA lysidine(34) synthetase TilS [Halobacillus yeomjeoni]MCA0985618.1 tRNA lysidine(34) synthetase TilS [Halobacillus yeomjeoni]
MEQKVHSFIKKHELIRPGQTILAAVSGGPDSMALLHYFCAIKEEYQLQLHVVSIDHGLRGEDSYEDLAYVKRMCEQWNVDFTGTSVDVPSYKSMERMGTQETARKLRYDFFKEMMDEKNIDVLALGHHGDDQAETMMMQMVRNATPESIQGIPVRRAFGRGEIIRPFLNVTKDEIIHYLKKHHVEFRVDVSNEETDYTRNAFRKHVIPYFRQQNPKFSQHMQRLSERLRDDQEYIKEQAKEVLKTMDFSSKEERCVRFSIQTFKTFPLALQRSAFHLILNYLYVDQADDISYLHEEMFMDLISEQKSNATMDFPRGLKIIRAYDSVTLTFRIDEDIEPLFKTLQIGETIQLPDGSLLQADWTDRPEEEGTYVYLCDSHHVKLPLVVRTRMNGDRIRVRGMNGSKKVKDIFIDQKIPSDSRNSWPLVTDSNGDILWLIGLKKGGEYIRKPSGKWLRLKYENKADK